MVDTARTRLLAGVPIRTSTPDDASRWVCEQASGSPRSQTDIHLANAYTLSLTGKDPSFGTFSNERLQPFLTASRSPGLPGSQKTHLLKSGVLDFLTT